MKTNSERSEGVEKTRKSIYSREWMAGFLKEAFGSCDIAKAAGNAGVTLATIHACRLEDPAFAQACLDLEDQLNRAIAWSLKSKAATGDNRSISLMLRRGQEIEDLAGNRHASGFDTRVAAAMLAAGLDEWERINGIPPRDQLSTEPREIRR